jgi:hypothetical protein
MKTRKNRRGMRKTRKGGWPWSSAKVVPNNGLGTGNLGNLRRKLRNERPNGVQYNGFNRNSYKKYKDNELNKIRRNSAQRAANKEAAHLAANEEAARLAANQEAARLAANQEAARLAAAKKPPRITSVNIGNFMRFQGDPGTYKRPPPPRK